MLRNGSNIVRFAIDSCNPSPLSDKQRSELEALNTMPDDAIDYSDIPRLPDEFWKNATCGPHRKLFEIAAEIVQAQIASTSMDTVEISSSLRMVFQTLQAIQKLETAVTILAPQMPPQEALKPVVPQDSIREDKIICLECGAEMRQLTSRHLASHGMDQRQYKKKYGFAMRTPLAAKSLTKARSKAAKKRGLPEKLEKFIEARRQAKADEKTTSEPKAPVAKSVKKLRRRQND